MARTKKAAGRRDNRTGQIYQDGNHYRACLKVGIDPKSGRPRYRTARTKTHEAAIDALKRMQLAEAQGKLSQATGKNLGDYLNDWLAERIKPLRANATYRQYAWIVATHIAPHLGKKNIDKVTRQDVQNLISTKATQRVAARAKEKPAKQRPNNDSPIVTVEKKPKAPPKLLSSSTLRLIRAVLHAAYEDAIKDGLTGQNPAEHVELPQEQKKQAQFLTPREAQKLLAETRGRELGELFAFLLTTGTRIGEATGLRWQDVDLENRRVRIIGQLQRVNKKLTYKPSTKTNQERVLPISSELAQQLRDLKSRQIVEAAKKDPDGLVFLNMLDRRVDPKYASNRLKEACRRAEVPVVSPHKLRHTAATLALSETGDIHAVQKLLGHSQSALTTDLYAHATAETLRTATDAIARALTPLDQ